MRLLRETLQKRVMTMIGEVTDDVEEVSQRQMEANQFRSQILREVMEILQSEIPEEGSNSANGFEYSYRRGRQRVFNEVDPFNEATAIPSFKNESVFLSDFQLEYETKRQRMNEEYFASLKSGVEMKRDEEEEEDDNVMLYTHLNELMKGNDPSIQRYDHQWEWEDDPVMREWLIDEEHMMEGDNSEEMKREGIDGLKQDVMVKEESILEEVMRKEDVSGEVIRKESVSNEDFMKESPCDEVLGNESSIQTRLSDSESDDPLIIHTSTDGSIIVSHSSTMYRDQSTPSTTLITSFTDALAKTDTSPIQITVTQPNITTSLSTNTSSPKYIDSLSSSITPLPPSEQQNEAQKELFARLIHTSPTQLGERREGLLKQYRHFSSQNAFVSEDVVVDIAEILKIFGIPFIFAPGEAEAQCAFLEMMGLVDGVISNDSDVFAFGGKSLYKDFFLDNQYVQAYRIEDIEKELGLNRERIIEYAILEGCDYCDVTTVVTVNL